MENTEKTIAEKIVERIGKFKDDLAKGRPIKTRTVSLQEWKDAIELKEELKE